jgi:hypothetical protein
MTAVLILASALAGQCANGTCPAPARYSYGYTYSQPAPQYYLQAPRVVAAPVKTWHTLSSHPGYLGYGALNARGEVVVEFHCRAGSTEVVAGPAPSVVSAKSEPCGLSGCACGCGSGKVCGCPK